MGSELEGKVIKLPSELDHLDEEIAGQVFAMRDENAVKDLFNFIVVLEALELDDLLDICSAKFTTLIQSIQNLWFY